MSEKNATAKMIVDCVCLLLILSTLFKNILRKRSTYLLTNGRENVKRLSSTGTVDTTEGTVAGSLGISP